MEAIEKAGYLGRCDLGMDCAASEFWVPEKKKYDLDFKNPKNDGSFCVTQEELCDIYEKFA